MTDKSPRPKTPFTPVALLLLASIVGPTLLFGVLAWESRHRVISETEQSARQTANILREHATKVFEEQTLVLEQIDRRIRGMSWDEIGRSEELHRDLAAIDQRFQQVGAIWLVDPQGHPRASSNFFPLVSPQGTRRDYFKVQQDHDAGVYVDTPIVGSLRGSVQIPVSRRRSTADGHFDGVIVLAISPDYFKDFYATTAANDNGVVTLARTDGEILVRYPSIELPRSLPADGPLMTASRQSDNGVYRGPSPIDGRPLVAAFSRLQDFPVAVFYGVDFDSVLARWHMTLWIYALYIVPVALALFLTSWLAFTRTREQQAAFVLLAEAQARAEAADRAKSDFLANMSHEMRTPLNAVIGFAQLLEHISPTSLSERQREYLHYIQRGGQQLLNLVRDVLDLAKIESGKLHVAIQSIAISDVLGELSSTMSLPAKDKGLSFSVESDKERRWTVWGDRDRLLQVLINLVSNAIKYNRPGGSVRVTTAAAPVEGWLRIVVEDTGRGIALDRQHELFKPFNRLGAERSAIEGTGVGLSICQRLVGRMGGSIGFWSEPGVGSRFWVDLPETRLGGETTDKPPSDTDDPPLKAAAN
jgi:signal transduction histidine kinase